MVNSKGKYKVGKWVIADIDNALSGNSLFNDIIERPPAVEDPIFEGSDMDPSKDLNIRA